MRIPVPVHRIHPVGTEANESPRQLNTLFGGDGIVEWFKALPAQFQDQICKMFFSSITLCIVVKNPKINSLKRQFKIYNYKVYLKETTYP